MVDVCGCNLRLLRHVLTVDVDLEAQGPGDPRVYGGTSFIVRFFFSRSAYLSLFDSKLSETLLAGAVRYRLKRGAVFKKNQIL